jgi:hypothetical protein
LLFPTVAGQGATRAISGTLGVGSGSSSGFDVSACAHDDLGAELDEASEVVECCSTATDFAFTGVASRLASFFFLAFSLNGEAFVSRGAFRMALDLCGSSPFPERIHLRVNRDRYIEIRCLETLA